MLVFRPLAANPAESIVKAIQVGERPGLMFFNPDMTQIWVVNLGKFFNMNSACSISVIDVASQQVVQTIAAPLYIFGFGSNVVFDPVAPRAVISSTQTDEVLKIDTDTYTITAALKLTARYPYYYTSVGPAWLTLSPDGTFLCCSNTFNETVSVIDTANLTESWVDWNSIPKGVDWEQEIYRCIEQANVFLFLVSTDSVTSEMCNKEIAHAVKNSKRFIPIFVANTEDRGMYSVTEKFPGKEQKQEIGRRNFIKCREGRDDIDRAIDEIERTIQTDYEWLKYQSRLQLKALEWARAKKDNSRLLRGKELREAEEKLATVGEKTEPKPTELQNLYLISSKKHEKVVRRRVIAAGVVATLVILAISAAWSTLTRERAIPGNWVTIPEGEFTMGMDQKEAEAAHSLCMEGALESQKENCTSPEDLLAWSVLMENVELSTFRIMDNEVTNAQCQQCIESGSCNPPAEWKYEKDGTNKPATGLNWFDAGEYCTWLEGRLPTEIEWEKAAGGPDGKNYYFPWGNTWDENKANLEQSGIRLCSKHRSIR